MSRCISPAIGLALLLSLWMNRARGADFEANPQPPDGPPASTEGSPIQLSTPALEVLRLAQSGVGESVILTYIDGSPEPFALTTDHIVYLTDLGIESPVITAMLRHDRALEKRPQPSPERSAAPASPDAGAPATQEPPPVYVTNAPPDVAYFHSALVPYGAWIVLDDLGWCWRPHIVTLNRTWRPYWHGGRWLYTDCGWYWQSDYSWGWAVFHHGRWHHHDRHGWIWFPDRVWAPAWVSWRYSNTHCGWAPLPPGAHLGMRGGFEFNRASVGINFDFGLRLDHFSFVEIRHLHEHHLHRHAIPAPRAHDVFNHTTVVNNYQIGNQNRIINPGVAVDRVAGASRRRIRPVIVRDAPTLPGQSGRPDRIDKQGSNRVIYRPPLTPPANPAGIGAQKVDERHPVVRPILSPPPRTPVPPPRPTRPTTPAPARSATPAPARPTTPRPTPPSARQQERGLALPGQTVRPQSLQPWQPQPPRTLPAVPRVAPARPMAVESPRGREQRLSNGRPMQSPSGPTSIVAPPAGRPVAPPSQTPDNEQRKK